MFEFAGRIAKWSDDLARNHEWNVSLESAFDKVGFTQKYIEALDPDSFEPKAIKDHVWGMITLDPISGAIVDCPLLQRLRWVHQTGFSYFTYPNANHSRFEHSLGVFHVVNLLLESFRDRKALTQQLRRSNSDESIHCYDDKSRQWLLIRYAALLHDLGHAAFSHVSENIFTGRQHDLKIGPFTVRDFVGEFRAQWGRSTDNVAASEASKTKLSEMLSVAIITSSRFKQFFLRLRGPTELRAREDLCDISALILGARIEDNDFALPEILSGPVDADKIDYLLRDAKTCGLTTGIDVSRIFFRASIYSGAASSIPLRDYQKARVNNNKPVKLFVIDQSGSDASRELNFARMSLYQRLYFHQVTRAAEAIFGLAIDALIDARTASAPYATDFIELWATPEIEVLRRLSSDHGLPSIAKRRAISLMTRQLPKRAGCIGERPDWFTWPVTGGLAFQDRYQAARNLVLRKLSNDLKKRMQDRPDRQTLLDHLIQKCEELRQSISAGGADPAVLPKTIRPSEIVFVPPPDRDAADPKDAWILRSGRIAKLGQHQASYLQAGEMPSLFAYIRTDQEWREIMLLALQAELYENFLHPENVAIPFHSSGTPTNRQSAVETMDLQQIQIHGRATIDPIQIASEAKVDIGRLRDLQRHLTGSGYFDACPSLYPHDIDAEVIELSVKFHSFEGVGGWKVTRDGHDIAAFLSQFPPRLRDAVIALLHKVDILSRKSLAEKLVAGIRGLSLPGPIYLVPLSPSSGHYSRVALQHEPTLASLNCNVRSSLRDALGALRQEDGSLVFIDDNVASGTQASRQINAFFQNVDLNLSSNYFAAPLPPQDADILRNLLKTRRVAFIFAVGHPDGGDQVKAAARPFADGSEVEVAYGDDLLNFSGQTDVSDELREFLRDIGSSVLARIYKAEGESPDAAQTRANERALGYGGMQGLLITPFSVPSSTYTALWCPGRYKPKGSNFEIPWLPLFLRSDKLQYLELP